MSTLAEKTAALRAKRALQAAPKLPDTLADLGKEDRRSVDDELDGIIDGLDPIECYRRWVGKMEPVDNGRVEGVLISCPIPGHADTHPSAWVNTEKKTWFCGGCQQGGDLHDWAAWHHRYDVPGYKHGESFPKLRRQMAEDFGYRVKTTISGSSYINDDNRSVTVPEPSVTPGQTTVTVVERSETDFTETLGNIIEFPLQTELQPLSIDWQSLIPEETFLHKWMKMMSVDDLPEEFYFWVGLLAVGLAAGRQAVMPDRKPVKPNLFVCLYGPSGIGKSRSTDPLFDLLIEALPYDRDDPNSTGIQIVPMPGSPEALIDSFSKPILDPNDPKKPPMGYGAVRGLINFDELSALMARANRPTNGMKPHLMSFYDCGRPVETTSRGFGYVKADHHFASLITTTQPGAIRDILVQSDADSGFINRFVFASGPLKPLRSLHGDVLDVSTLVGPLNSLRQWTSGRFRQITLAGAGFDIWDKFFRRTIEPMKNSSEKPLLTRSDLLLKKLMLLFSINEKQDTVSADIVERVLTLWPYIERSFDMLVTEIGIGPQQECRTKILAAISTVQQKTNKGVTAREISRRLGKRFPPDLIVRTLKAMESLGDIQESMERTGIRGPVTERYQIINDA